VSFYKCEKGSLTSVIYSRDGTEIYAAFDGGLFTLDAKELRITRPWMENDREPLYWLQTVPKADLLIGAGASGIHRLFKVTSREPINRPVGHLGHVFCLTFSPDDAILWSGCYYGWVVGWDVKQGTHQIKSKLHDWGVTAITAIGNDTFSE